MRHHETLPAVLSGLHKQAVLFAQEESSMHTGLHSSEDTVYVVEM